MTQNTTQVKKSRSFPEQSVFVSSIPSSMVNLCLRTVLLNFWVRKSVYSLLYKNKSLTLSSLAGTLKFAVYWELIHRIFFNRATFTISPFTPFELIFIIELEFLHLLLIYVTYLNPLFIQNVEITEWKSSLALSIT